MDETDCPPHLADLDEHSRAILSIETAVSVTLAVKKIPLHEIVDLVPGAMVTFEAHCDEPLKLEAGGTTIAIGETVKIGDKFGLRIREMVSDDEE